MERRRSSATVLVGATMLTALVNAMPLDLEAGSCSNSVVLDSLNNRSVDAEGFCRGIAPEAAPVETKFVTSTSTEGSLTVFYTTEATPTFTLTVMVDNIVTVTPLCSQPAAAPAITPVAAAQDSPAAAVVAKPASSPVVPSRAQPKVAGPRHGRRDTELPDYVAQFEEKDISAGCSCFMADKTSTIVQAAATITETVQPTATATWTSYGEGTASVVRVGATRTVTATGCV